MHPAARVLQVLALTAFTVLAALPLHLGRTLPVPRARSGAAGAAAGDACWTPLTGYDIPCEALGRALVRDLSSASPATHLWRERRWYPFLLAPLWILALLYGAGSGPGALARRRRAGALLLVLAAGLAVFEACYLAHEYAPLLPDLLGRAEGALVWLLVVAVLFARRRADRRLDALEAHVGAQALLGLMHFVTLPSSQARPWMREAALGDVARALVSNFPPAFWLALGLLALAAAPAYLGRGAAARVLPEPATAGGSAGA